MIQLEHQNYPLADNSGLKSDKDINLASIVFASPSRGNRKWSSGGTQHEQPRTSAYMAGKATSMHPWKTFVETGKTLGVWKSRPLYPFIECFLDRLVEAGLIHFEEFGRQATIEHIFQGREDTKTVLDSFCWVWDALKKMGIWKIDMDPTELAVVVVFFDNLGGVLLTTTDEKAVEVPLHVTASVAALDACVEELLQGTDPSSQVIVYMTLAVRATILFVL